MNQNDHIACKSLWACVLINAIEDATGNPKNCNYYKTRKQHVRTARDWFKSNRDEIGSFVFVCQALNLNSGAVRKKALNGQPIFLPPDMDFESLPYKMIFFRKLHRMTQTALAVKTGLCPTTISNIERGKIPEHSMRNGNRKRILDFIANSKGDYEPVLDLMA